MILAIEITLIILAAAEGVKGICLLCMFIRDIKSKRI